MRLPRVGVTALARAGLSLHRFVGCKIRSELRASGCKSRSGRRKVGSCRTIRHVTNPHARWMPLLVSPRHLQPLSRKPFDHPNSIRRPMVSRILGVNASVTALLGETLALAKLLPHRVLAASFHHSQTGHRRRSAARGLSQESFNYRVRVACSRLRSVQKRYFILTPPCNHGYSAGGRWCSDGVSAGRLSGVDNIIVGGVYGERPFNVAPNGNNQRRKGD